MSTRKRLRSVSVDESSNGSVPEAKKTKQNGGSAEGTAGLAPTGLRTSDLREPAPLFDDIVSMGLLPAGRERQITVEEARAGTEGWLKGWSCCWRRPSAVVWGEGERGCVTVRVCGRAVLYQASDDNGWYARSLRTCKCLMYRIVP